MYHLQSPLVDHVISDMEVSDVDVFRFVVEFRIVYQIDGTLIVAVQSWRFGVIPFVQVLVQLALQYS